MQYIGSAVTDIGISKKTNQDSACIKIANTEKYGQAALAVLCDGMGGLDKGELASATVIRAFSQWFEQDFPSHLNHLSMKSIIIEWNKMIKELNDRIGSYGKQFDVRMGTTLTAVLMINNKYIAAHVGDSRLYEITNEVKQLTEDQTFVAREISRGNMTPEAGAKDSRRNMLLQCVGASKNVTAQILQGSVKSGCVFMLCSDGFRHVLSDEEIYESFEPSKIADVLAMEQSSRDLIRLIKNRQEKDNITVALLKCI